MNSPTNVTPQQLRHAADIQERILVLQDELSEILGGSSAGTGIPAPTRRRRLSAQGLANIRAGARKRWARVRGESGGNQSGRKPWRRRMSPAAKAAIAARMRARWAAAKRAGRNAL